MKKLITIAAAITLAGCATNPNKIDATYVSPLKYASYDCAQLEAEQRSVEARTRTLYKKLDREHEKDNAKMGVGLFLLWPTLFFISGDGPEAAEYAQLKGDYQAIEDAAIQKRCGMTFDGLTEAKL